MGVVKCSTHPDRFSTGVCARCKMQTCDLCCVDVGGARYCSIICFTEKALEDKGKQLSLKRPDPLADVPLKDDSSVVLPAVTAQNTEDSSVAVSAVDGEDVTSILDMEALKKKAQDESSVAPVEGRMKEPTSILGMHELARRAPDGTWVEDPPSETRPQRADEVVPSNETPLPILLPGTRRSTIQSTCVFHSDTPAVVLCGKCGDAICTMCIQDEDQGGRCSPACRRDSARARGKKLMLVAGGVAAALVVAWVALTSRRPNVEGAAARIESPAEFEARSREAERVRLEAEAREEARKRVEAREKEEREKIEAEARAKAEAEAKARAEEARLAAVAKAEADAKAALAKAEAESKAKAEAEAKLKMEADAKAKAEAEAKAKEEAAKVAKLKAEAEAKAKMEAEAKAKEDAAKAAKLKAEAEAKAKMEAEAKAKEDAAKAAKLKTEAEAKAKMEAEAKAKEDAAKAAKLKAESEAKAKMEAEAKAKEDAAKAAKAKAEAEAKAKMEAEARAKAEAEKAKAEAEAKAKTEAEAKAKAAAEAKAVVVANSFNRVSALIREATPEFRALADDSVPLGQAAIPRIDAVLSKLSDARATYIELLNDANDRALVERRIAILGDLVATLRNSRARAAEAR